MNDLRIFKNTEFGELGIMLIDGKEYFPATQCAKILGYANPYDAIKRHCKVEGVVKCEGVSYTTNQHNVTTQQVTEINYINEGNLYRLIVGSKLPAAEKFEHWVFDEVLPTIRKTGSYSITDSTYSNADMALLKIVKAGTAEERALAVSEYNEIVVKPLEDKIEKQKPLVEVAEKRISNKGCYSITDITKSLNLKRGYITRWAKAKGYLHQSLNEVNKAGEKFFKVYSTDFIHNSIGITEEGLQFIKNHIAEIYDLNSTEKF